LCRAHIRRDARLCWVFEVLENGIPIDEEPMPNRAEVTRCCEAPGRRHGKKRHAPLDELMVAAFEFDLEHVLLRSEKLDL
jgi:hypothetical protein